MKRTDPKTELIRASRLGRVLTDDQVRKTAETAEHVEAAAGTRLFEEGSPATALWVVTSGTVSIELHAPGQSDSRILTLGARDLLGWSALVGDGEMTASAVVTKDAHLLKLPAEKVKELCIADCRLGFAVMGNVARVLANRLKATRLQLLDVHEDLPESIEE